MNQDNLGSMPEKHGHCGWIKYISWSPIIVGTLVAIGISFLFNIFALAIGLSAFTTSKEGTMAIAIGGFIGLLIISIVTMFVAGWIAGYLGRLQFLSHHAGYFNHRLGALYGFVTWCLTLVVMVLLISNVNRYVSTYHATLTSPRPDIVIANIDNNTPVSMDRNKSTVSANTPSTTTVVADKEKAAHELGVSFFAIFILFFVGAFSSCLGGYCGFCPGCKGCCPGCGTCNKSKMDKDKENMMKDNLH
jgi:hypothetical protein